jgi:hypothetical protein
LIAGPAGKLPERVRPFSAKGADQRIDNKEDLWPRGGFEEVALPRS